MDEERTLIIGFDLCDDFSQISSFQKNSNDPESVCITPDKTKYLIPTAVCVRENTKEWVIGEEAERCRDRAGGIYVEHLLERLIHNESASIYGSVITADVLLEKFFRKVLGIIRQRFLNNSILQMVITLKQPSADLKTRLYTILERLGLMQDRVSIISHTMSFMYYMVSQPKDLWPNDVALFDYDTDGLAYYQLSFGHRSQPMTVFAKREDLSDSVSFDMLMEKPIERLRYSFNTVANLALHKKLISSVFVTGRGFEGNWADDVLRSMCMGRRVFKGQNLYTKGACFAARSISQNKQSDYLFLTEEMVPSHIFLRVYSDAKVKDLPLVQAGMCYDECDVSLDLILDATNELVFTVCDALKQDSVMEIMTLDYLQKRENKTTRLRLHLYFLDRETPVVKIQDTGFGEFHPTNYRIWEQRLKL